MTNYILIILSVGICAFILETVLSSFDSYKNISGAIKFIYSLCIFCAIIFPVSNIKLDFYSLQKQSNITTGSIIENPPTFELLLENELCEKIKSEIFKQLGIQTHNICIQLNSGEDNKQKSIYIESATFVFSEDNKENFPKILNFLKTLPELEDAQIKLTVSEKD